MGSPFYLRNNYIHKSNIYKRQLGYTNAIKRIILRYYQIELEHNDVIKRYRRIQGMIREQFPDDDYSHQDFETLVINDYLINDCL